MDAAAGGGGDDGWGPGLLLDEWHNCSKARALSEVSVFLVAASRVLKLRLREKKMGRLCVQDVSTEWADFATLKGGGGVLIINHDHCKSTEFPPGSGYRLVRTRRQAAPSFSPCSTCPSSRRHERLLRRPGR